MKHSHDIQSLEEVYLATIEENLRSVDRILAQLGIADIPREQLRGMLLRASQSLTQRWRTGRKTVRTQIAMRFIPDYPQEVLELSLALDAIINLLDDLLDELLAGKQKAAYILEFVRVLALFNHLHVPPEYQERIADYFNKGIGIVVAEIVYREKMKATDDFDDRLLYARQCYDAKGLVMDIFVELPLLALFGPEAPLQEVVPLARLHRAVSLLHKDFDDIAHDRENGTETPMVILADEGEERLRESLRLLLKHYRQRSEMLAPDGTLVDIKERIRALIRQEIDDFEHLLAASGR